MNEAQMQEMGISFGSQIYILSQRGWSGIYTVTDSGVAYGIVDIFLENYSSLPSWGVENGVAMVLV